MTTVERLDPPDVAAVTALLDAAEAVDGARAVSEQGELALRAVRALPAHPRDADDAPERTAHEQVRHLGVRDGAALLAYAQVEVRADGPVGVEGVVHPDHRRAGLGTALRAVVLDQLQGQAELLAWAHGDHAAAGALAASSGARRARELLQMRRPLTGDLADVVLPDGVSLRAFRPGEDDDAWLAVNARAFAHHPEQGAWTRHDLAARQAEPWFDSAGFLLAQDDASGELLGFHWTKVHAASAEEPAGDRRGIGEVYVVGVDPEAQGRRLGGALTLAGLHHLRGRGLDAVLLYVESDNTAALRVYRGLGFDVVRVDVQYALP